MAEITVRALSKLERMLPQRLRHQVAALAATTVAIPQRDPSIDPETLMTIASAARDRLRLHFTYRTHSGQDSTRIVEPHRLVHDGRRWYLVAWDVERTDWRTFRVDRVTPHEPSGPRFAPREPPAADLAEYVARGVGTATWRYRATVTVLASAATIRTRMPPGITVTPAGPRRCRVDVGADDPLTLARYVAMIDADVTIDPAQCPELAAALRLLAERFSRSH